MGDPVSVVVVSKVVCLVPVDPASQPKDSRVLVVSQLIGANY